MADNNPLITLGLIAYEQERFVREAVAGAFAQTYAPLEIILSDDCSKDRTFSVMQDMAAAYQGPHCISLNRNPVNLGLSGNINRVVELSRGRLIVIAAGDDVSLPDRVSALCAAWRQDPGRIMALQSAFDVIDENGAFVATVRKIRARNREVFENATRMNFQDYVRTLQLPMSGATFAYNRSLFDTFGLLPGSLVFEDNLITLRAILAGTMQVVDRPLVRRRMHGGNLMLRKTGVPRRSAEIQQEEERARLTSLRRVQLYEAFIEDIQLAAKTGLLAADEAAQALQTCRFQLEYHRLYYDYSRVSIMGKLRILRRLRDLGQRVGAMKYLLIRLIPWPVLRTGKSVVAPLRRPTVDPVLRGSEDFGVIDG